MFRPRRSQVRRGWNHKAAPVVNHSHLRSEGLPCCHGRGRTQPLGAGEATWLCAGTRLSSESHEASFSEKRAFRPARNRARQSLAGGTTYRGQWFTRAALQAINGSPSLRPTPRRVESQSKAQTSGKQPVIRCLSWNASGLSSALLQELIAWLDTENCCDVLVLQETHWGPCSDFYSGRWACLHSSGHGSDVSYDKHGGILIMANKSVFLDMAFKEVYPGRLVLFRATHAKTGLVFDLVGLYQHVWRIQLTSEQNITSIGMTSGTSFTPYSSVLSPQAPHVGPAATPKTAGTAADKALVKLLRDHNLCVLNSWAARPATLLNHTRVGPRLISS